MPGRAWPLWLARSGRFGRAWSPRTACSSPSSTQSRATRPPGRARQAIFDDLGSILASTFVLFRGFSRCHGAGDSTRCARARTFVFAGRRSTLEGSQARQKNAKSRKFDRTSLGRRFASEPLARSSPFSIPCVSLPRFSSPRRPPRRSEALLLVPGGGLEDSLGAAGMRRGSPKTFRRRFWDSFGALLGAWGVPRRSGTDFGSILIALGAFPGAPSQLALTGSFWLPATAPTISLSM